MIDSFGCTVSAGIHPPDPFHLVVGFQRFRNALSICHLFYQPKKKLLCLSVNVRKIGVQFATCHFNPNFETMYFRFKLIIFIQKFENFSF